jgi:hypothetical protein
VYEPRTWTNLGAIFLLGLTTARHKNQKIRYKNELLKAKEPAPDVYKCRIYRMTPKNDPMATGHSRITCKCNAGKKLDLLEYGIQQCHRSLFFKLKKCLV